MWKLAVHHRRLSLFPQAVGSSPESSSFSAPPTTPHRDSRRLPPTAVGLLTQHDPASELIESQHGRGWQGPLWVTQPNSLPKQGHPEQGAQHRGQAGLEYLQRRRLHSLPGQPGPGLCHPQREEVLPRVQTPPSPHTTQPAHQIIREIRCFFFLLGAHQGCCSIVTYPHWTPTGQGSAREFRSPLASWFRRTWAFNPDFTFLETFVVSQSGAFSESGLTEPGFLFSLWSNGCFGPSASWSAPMRAVLQGCVFLPKAEQRNTTPLLDQGLLAFRWLLCPGTSLLLLASSFWSPAWICHLSPIIRIYTEQSRLRLSRQKKGKDELYHVLPADKNSRYLLYKSWGLICKLPGTSDCKGCTKSSKISLFLKP